MDILNKNIKTFFYLLSLSPLFNILIKIAAYNLTFFYGFKNVRIIKDRKSDDFSDLILWFKVQLRRICYHSEESREQLMWVSSGASGN